MAPADWRLEGDWIKDCNCDFGCPCDFNARPTNGDCRGVLGMRIRTGHFENVRLDGLCFFVIVAFPGPLHEGGGEAQPIVDERATPDQRQALFNILSGRYSAEGTLFHICSLIVEKMHEPVFAPISFNFDLSGRHARLSIPDVIEAENEPIRNPVTGLPHRIRVVMPEGFEHHEAEVCSAHIASTGAIKFDVAQGHGSLAEVVQTPQGFAA